MRLDLLVDEVGRFEAGPVGRYLYLSIYLSIYLYLSTSIYIYLSIYLSI